MYSLRMSFWIVPVSADAGTPCSSPTSWYIRSSRAAGALIVIEVETSPSGIPCSRMRMSSTESMATPTLPTSPWAGGASESYPIWVGRSKAQDRPVWPASSRNLKRSLVCSAEPNPAYWRIVHNFERYMPAWTPRVYGNAPGSPSCVAGSQPSRSSAR